MGYIQGLAHAIEDHASNRPDRVAIRLDGRDTTYGELPGRVGACAEVLSRRLPRPDSRRPIALVGGSTPELAICLLALWEAGYGVLPLSERLPDAERRRIAAQAGAVTFLATDIEIGRATRRKNALVLDGWLALPSSGTLGEPKIVRRDPAAIDAVARQVAESVGLRGDDRVYAAIPLTHAYGLEAGLLAPLLTGACVELENAFEPVRLGDRLVETRATVLPAVPAMIDMLVRMHASDGGNRFPNLRRLLSAGAPLSADLWHQCHDRLGIAVANYYGATEIGSVCLADPDTPGHDASWLGIPMPGVSMCVLDPETHAPLRDGQTGEIAVDAPSAMSGYVLADGSLDRDSAFTTVNGRRWFLGGDLGVRHEDGHFRFVARNKLLIEVGANKVNPVEVETVLRLHPAVSDAVVRGEALSQTLVRLKADVEIYEGVDPPPAADLRAHCRHHLAAWKVPRSITIRPLVRTALGKVIRREVAVTGTS